MGAYINLTGQKFTRWEVLGPAGKHEKCGNFLWHVRCDCGTEKIVIGSSLKSGNSKSCGCLMKEVWAKLKQV